MPYPQQIDAETILQTAREMIERNGIDKLSLNKLAGEMGVKAPSLYRYYDSKHALLRAVNEDTLARLYRVLQPALELDIHQFDQILEVARCYREFAHQNAAVYGMLYTNTLDDLCPQQENNPHFRQSFAQVMQTLYGEEDAATTQQGFFALLHGFIMMELTEQVGQNADEMYEASVRALLDGWQRQR